MSNKEDNIVDLEEGVCPCSKAQEVENENGCCGGEKKEGGCCKDNGEKSKGCCGGCHGKDKAEEKTEEKELSPEELIKKLVEENNSLKNDVLRAFADAQNVKKRAEQDIKNNTHYAVSSIVKDMIPVADNLNRALAAFSDHVDMDSVSDDVKNLVTGIEMIEQSFISALESKGVKKIKTVGEKFDPSMHTAVSQVPGEEDGVIMQEVQAGYKMDGKIIREAMVIVSKK